MPKKPPAIPKDKLPKVDAKMVGGPLEGRTIRDDWGPQDIFFDGIEGKYVCVETNAERRKYMWNDAA